MTSVDRVSSNFIYFSIKCEHGASVFSATALTEMKRSETGLELDSNDVHRMRSNFFWKFASNRISRLSPCIDVTFGIKIQLDRFMSARAYFISLLQFNGSDSRRSLLRQCNWITLKIVSNAARSPRCLAEHFLGKCQLGKFIATRDFRNIRIQEKYHQNMCSPSD